MRPPTRETGVGPQDSPERQGIGNHEVKIEGGLLDGQADFQAPVQNERGIKEEVEDENKGAMKERPIKEEMEDKEERKVKERPIKKETPDQEADDGGLRSYFYGLTGPKVEMHDKEEDYLKTPKQEIHDDTGFGEAHRYRRNLEERPIKREMERTIKEEIPDNYGWLHGHSQGLRVPKEEIHDKGGGYGEYLGGYNMPKREIHDDAEDFNEGADNFYGYLGYDEDAGNNEVPQQRPIYREESEEEEAETSGDDEDDPEYEPPKAKGKKNNSKMQNRPSKYQKAPRATSVPAFATTPRAIVFPVRPIVTPVRAFATPVRAIATPVRAIANPVPAISPPAITTHVSPAGRCVLPPEGFPDDLKAIRDREPNKGKKAWEIIESTLQRCTAAYTNTSIGAYQNHQLEILKKICKEVSERNLPLGPDHQAVITACLGFDADAIKAVEAQSAQQNTILFGGYAKRVARFMNIAQPAQDQSPSSSTSNCLPDTRSVNVVQPAQGPGLQVRQAHPTRYPSTGPSSSTPQRPQFAHFGTVVQSARDFLYPVHLVSNRAPFPPTQSSSASTSQRPPVARVGTVVQPAQLSGHQALIRAASNRTPFPPAQYLPSSSLQRLPDSGSVNGARSPRDLLFPVRLASNRNAFPPTPSSSASTSQRPPVARIGTVAQPAQLSAHHLMVRQANRTPYHLARTPSPYPSSSTIQRPPPFRSGNVPYQAWRIQNIPSASALLPNPAQQPSSSSSASPSLSPARFSASSQSPSPAPNHRHEKSPTPKRARYQ